MQKFYYNPCAVDKDKFVMRIFTKLKIKKKPSKVIFYTYEIIYNMNKHSYNQLKIILQCSVEQSYPVTFRTEIPQTKVFLKQRKASEKEQFLHQGNRNQRVRQKKTSLQAR